MKTIQRKKEPTFFLNKDFQTIQVKVIFPFPKEEKNLAYVHILPNLLQLVCAKYPTERDYSLAMQKEYILNAMCTYSSMGELSYFTFHLTIPDTVSLRKDVLKEQFDLFSQMIYDPKLNGDAFCLEEFEREVSNLKVYVDKMMKESSSYAFIKAKEAVDPDGAFSTSIYNHLNLIEEANPKDLYQFYLDTIYNNHPLIYAFGNFDEDKLRSLCHEYLYRQEFDDEDMSGNLDIYVPIKETPTIVNEESNFRNSVYLTFYNVKDMSDDDKILLDTVKNLLSSQSSRLLNKKLRDEHELVYSSYAINYDNNGLLAVCAYIHQSHKEETKEKIKEALKDLENEEIVSEYLPILKERFRLGLIRKLDDKMALFQEKVLEDLGIDDTSDEYYQKLCNLTPSDISQFMKRLILNTEYFLKEGEHE